MPLRVDTACFLLSWLINGSGTIVIPLFAFATARLSNSAEQFVADNYYGQPGQQGNQRYSNQYGNQYYNGMQGQYSNYQQSGSGYNYNGQSSSYQYGNQDGNGNRNIQYSTSSNTASSQSQYSANQYTARQYGSSQYGSSQYASSQTEANQDSTWYMEKERDDDDRNKDFYARWYNSHGAQRYGFKPWQDDDDYIKYPDFQRDNCGLFGCQYSDDAVWSETLSGNPAPFWFDWVFGSGPMGNRNVAETGVSSSLVKFLAGFYVCLVSILAGIVAYGFIYAKRHDVDRLAILIPILWVSAGFTFITAILVASVPGAVGVDRYAIAENGWCGQTGVLVFMTCVLWTLFASVFGSLFSFGTFNFVVRLRELDEKKQKNLDKFNEEFDPKSQVLEVSASTVPKSTFPLQTAIWKVNKKPRETIPTGPTFRESSLKTDQVTEDSDKPDIEAPSLKHPPGILKTSAASRKTSVLMKLPKDESDNEPCGYIEAPEILHYPIRPGTYEPPTITACALDAVTLLRNESPQVSASLSGLSKNPPGILTNDEVDLNVHVAKPVADQHTLAEDVCDQNARSAQSMPRLSETAKTLMPRSRTYTPGASLMVSTSRAEPLARARTQFMQPSTILEGRSSRFDENILTSPKDSSHQNSPTADASYDAWCEEKFAGSSWTDEHESPSQSQASSTFSPEQILAALEALTPTLNSSFVSDRVQRARSYLQEQRKVKSFTRASTYQAPLRRSTKEENELDKAEESCRYSTHETSAEILARARARFRDVRAENLVQNSWTPPVISSHQAFHKDPEIASIASQNSDRSQSAPKNRISEEYHPVSPKVRRSMICGTAARLSLSPRSRGLLRYQRPSDEQRPQLRDAESASRGTWDDEDDIIRAASSDSFKASWNPSSRQFSIQR